MSDRPEHRGLSARDVEPILAVASKLAAPFDLQSMLTEVVDAAKQVLGADRGTVWLYDPKTDELVLEVATGIAPVRVPAGAGIAGSCARTREIINVPDCYADPRFNPDVDKRSGYRTRCMLTLPLIDHKDVLVGVMQVLNKTGGVFDADDEALATALAAQCAVALQRVRLTEALIEGEKLRQEMEMARVVQMSTLPATMPAVPGYDVFGTFKPADLTGGDTFDLSLLDQGLLVVLGDATGHGIAPALSVTQMQAMLRTAFRLGADLETAFTQVNNQLAETLPDDRFITAFIGLLDAAGHRLRFHSGGQGPIILFRATGETFERFKPTSFPLAAMPLHALRPSSLVEFQPGDILVLLSDGIYEYHDGQQAQFGEQRVEDLIRAHHQKPMAELSALLLQAVQEFARGAPQEDDMTVVLVKRAPQPIAEQRLFPRTFESLRDIFAFTAQAFARLGVSPDLLQAVDFTVEELFTNMVKYSTASQSAVRLELRPIAGGVEAILSDYDVDAFDVTQAPDANIDLPIEQRRPGGLGLHLIRRLVDSIEYHYFEDTRQSRITFRKTVEGASASERAAGPE
ncbi:MAG: GAF domain-containing protein [Betaproteobacteria bacterium]|nr:MAG: GAF domain-containing protein [Betaproteobacteria bacterium]